MSRRDEILSQVTSVPSLPAVVCQLQQYLDDPEVNFSKLARVIECDPGPDRQRPAAGQLGLLRLAGEHRFGA